MSSIRSSLRLRIGWPFFCSATLRSDPSLQCCLCSSLWLGHPPPEFARDLKRCLSVAASTGWNPPCAGYAVPRDLAAVLHPPRSDALSCPPRHRLARQSTGASRSCMHVALCHVATSHLPAVPSPSGVLGSTAALLAAAVEYSRERWRCLRIDSIQPATTGVQCIQRRRVRHALAGSHGMQCIAWRDQVHFSPDPHEVANTVRVAVHGLRCVLRIACCAGRVLAATSVASCLLYFIIRGSPTRRLGVPTSRHTGATSTRMRRRRALRTADVLQTTRSIQRAAYNTRAACITLAACTTEHNSLQHAPKRCLPLCAAGWRRRRRWSSVRP